MRTRKAGTFLCLLALMIHLVGCAGTKAQENEYTPISSQEAFALLSSAFESCIAHGELKYSIEQSTLGNGTYAQNEDGTLRFQKNETMETVEQRNTNILMDDILYTRSVSLDRRNHTSTISLLKSEPDCVYYIEGTNNQLAETGFSSLNWTLTKADKKDTSDREMDPQAMLNNACFMLVSNLVNYDSQWRVYTGCREDEFSWSRRNEDGVIYLQADGNLSEELNNVFKDDFPAVAAFATKFQVQNAQGNITINEDEQLVTIDYSLSIAYTIEGVESTLIQNGKINFMAYSYRIPSYGTINQIIEDLDFQEDSGKPENLMDSFTY